MVPFSPPPASKIITQRNIFALCFARKTLEDPRKSKVFVASREPALFAGISRRYPPRELAGMFKHRHQRYTLQRNPHRISVHHHANIEAASAPPSLEVTRAKKTEVSQKNPEQTNRNISNFPRPRSSFSPLARSKGNKRGDSYRRGEADVVRTLRDVDGVARRRII